MLIALHCILLGLAAVSPAGVFLFKVGETQPRMTSRLVSSLLPFLGIGIISMLLLNMGGVPAAEWIVPAVSSIVIALFAGSEVARRVLTRSLVALSIVLCGSFLFLVSFGGYTANKKGIEDLSQATVDGLITLAREDIAKRFANEDDIPIGYVSDIVGNDLYDKCWLWFSEPEWHTPFTRLRHVHMRSVSIWHTGNGLFEVKEGEKVSGTFLGVRRPCWCRATATTRRVGCKT